VPFDAAIRRTVSWYRESMPYNPDR
jgi:hypothetical protein